jgi:hypothetical protein
MLKILRITFALVLFAVGLCGLVWVPICAFSFANMGMGGADLTQYLMFGVLSLPFMLLCIGLILWARSLYRRR